MPNVLLVCTKANLNVGTIAAHVKAITQKAGDYCVTIDHSELRGIRLGLFDCVVFHYSIVMCMEQFISIELREKLSNFNGLKVAFIQDEYRFIDATAKALKELGISYCFTLVSGETIRKVYHHDYLKDVEFETTLTGYVPEGWVNLNAPDYIEREIDVSYRARRLISWLGEHSLQKWQIAERFIEDIEKCGVDLVTDISLEEKDRVYGDQWRKMLFNSKAVLGVESGASVCDFSGEIELKTIAYLNDNSDASFEDLRNRFFANVDGLITQKVISPRCFEAAAARTLMVLYPGFYNGILVPSRHYVELKKDHSNLPEVIETIRNADKAKAIINNAYHEIALNEKYQQGYFATRLDKVIREKTKQRAGSRLAIKLHQVEIAFLKVFSLIYRAFLKVFSLIYRAFLKVFSLIYRAFLKVFSLIYRAFLKVLFLIYRVFRPDKTKKKPTSVN